MEITHYYQIGFAGQSNGLDETIKDLIRKHMSELSVSDDKIIFYDEDRIQEHNRKFPFCVVFFGYEGAGDIEHPKLKWLRDDSVFILPVVEDLEKFPECVPGFLREINGTRSDNHERITSALMEYFRLLRPERRLFISYKRNESQSIAIQLYEKLESAGFDVFLDTHSVSPGEEFQEVLWHRLADSDIMILLETPGFRESFWTQEELGKANTTNIQILHLLWPGVGEDQTSAFSKFMQLSNGGFDDSNHKIGTLAKLSYAVETDIVNETEKLRARALAARYRDLVDNFLDQAQTLNLSATIQPERFISLEVNQGKKIAIVPAVGVPNARTYEQIERKVLNTNPEISNTWLLFDQRGILTAWLNHLEWLNTHLPLISVKASEATKKMQQEIKQND